MLKRCGKYNGVCWSLGARDRVATVAGNTQDLSQEMGGQERAWGGLTQGVFHLPRLAADVRFVLPTHLRYCWHWDEWWWLSWNMKQQRTHGPGQTLRKPFSSFSGRKWYLTMGCTCSRPTAIIIFDVQPEAFKTGNPSKLNHAHPGSIHLAS